MLIAASVKPCSSSNCPRHTLQAHTITWCPWPRYCATVTLSWFNIDPGIKVCFCEAVIAASVKPCIVIVLDRLFKHTLWPGALDLDIELEWLLSRFYIKSSIKVCFSVAVTAVMVKPSIVQAPTEPCGLDLDFALIMKTCLFKYIENFTTKKGKFKKKILIFFIFLLKTGCGYSLELPQWGGSNEYPQSMLLSKNKKNNVYPCKPQFYFIKWGLRGSKIYRYVFVMLQWFCPKRLLCWPVEFL